MYFPITPEIYLMQQDKVISLKIDKIVMGKYT